MLQKARDTGYIDINCVDPLGRSGLLMAIDNENLEMVELLIEYRVETKDALLHAISEEYVEAVEVLLDHEETVHREGEPHVRKILSSSMIVVFHATNTRFVLLILFDIVIFDFKKKLFDSTNFK